jgi:hypothetical protein
MKQKHKRKVQSGRKHPNPDEIKEKEKKDAFRQGQQDNSTAANEQNQLDKKKNEKNLESSGRITNKDNDITNTEEQNRLEDDLSGTKYGINESIDGQEMAVEIPWLNPEIEIRPTKM